MLGRLFGNGTTKMWKIEKHRVKKVTVTVPNNTYPPSSRKETRYKCVDCEKKHRKRDDFKEDECYDVIRV